MYKPKRYWELRGKNYIGTEIDAEVIHMLSVLPKNRSVLEIGSGYGRIYNAIKESYESITLCDFAESMREFCEKTTGKAPDEWDGRTLPYSDGSFGLVILFDVLMHVPPADLRQVFGEAVRVSNEFLYVASYTGGSTNKVEHVFEHDFAQLFTDFALRVVDDKLFVRKSAHGNPERHLWLLQQTLAD